MHGHRWIVQGLSIFDEFHGKQPKVTRITVWAVVRDRYNQSSKFYKIKNVELHNASLDMAVSLIRAYQRKRACKEIKRCIN